MNPVSSRSEGSTREECPTLDPATHHWACGMPLSYVLEMANLGLQIHDQATKLDAPAVPASDSDRSPQPNAA